VEIGHAYAYEVTLGRRNREERKMKMEDGDLILILTRRIALQQKLGFSHIRWSEMERTYRKDKKKKGAG
jgi:hypothetical protein